MRYYKIIDGEYIIAIGTGAAGGVEISETEYNDIMEVILARPNEDGKEYKLRTDITWEVFDAPDLEEDPSDEVSYAEIISALEEVLAE